MIQKFAQLTVNWGPEAGVDAIGGVGATVGLGIGGIVAIG